MRPHSTRDRTRHASSVIASSAWSSQYFMSISRYMVVAVARFSRAWSRVPGVRRRRFERAISQAPRLVETAEQQTGATHRVVVPAAMGEEPSRRLTLDERFTLPEPVHRLAQFVELRQRPGGVGDKV